jgi:hypothetical protein
MLNIAENPAHVLAYLVVILMLLSLHACAGSMPATQTPQANEPTLSPAAHQGVVKKPAYLSPLRTTIEPILYSQGNPAPLGTAVSIDHMSLKVMGLVRPADALAAKGNMFNATPAPGQEYIFVNLSATCQQPHAQTCVISDSDFQLVGSSGRSHDAQTFLAGVSGLLGSVEFNGGTTRTGYVAFFVDKGEANLTLDYAPFMSNEEVFMAVGQ